jgi:hypothetical protein
MRRKRINKKKREKKSGNRIKKKIEGKKLRNKEQKLGSG